MDRRDPRAVRQMERWDIKDGPPLSHLTVSQPLKLMAHRVPIVTVTSKDDVKISEKVNKSFGNSYKTLVKYLSCHLHHLMQLCYLHSE